MDALPDLRVKMNFEKAEIVPNARGSGYSRDPFEKRGVGIGLLPELFRCNCLGERGMIKV